MFPVEHECTLLVQVNPSLRRSHDGNIRIDPRHTHGLSSFFGLPLAQSQAELGIVDSAAWPLCGHALTILLLALDFGFPIFGSTRFAPMRRMSK